jgi:uncharacterized protein (TIGR03437 family)
VKSAIIGALVAPLLLMGQQNGGAWTNIGPSPAAVEAIAVDPQGTGNIFMGTIAGGVRKSMDGGNTWSAVNSGLTTPIIQALAMDASGPQTVYAGTVGGGLFKTADGGATWQNIPAISGSIASITADPKRAGVVYAGVFNNLGNGSIRKSTDGGVTWTTVFPTTAAIFDIAIDRGNPDVIYIPTVGHGAFKSTDGGLHFTPMPTLTPQAIWTLAVDPGNSQVVYAGTNQDGIWKSSDAGNTWQQAGSPGPFPVYSLAVDTTSHIAYAGTNGGGVLTSADGGATWKSSSLANGMVLSLAVDSSGALYAGTSSADAQVSHDHGVTWTLLNTGVDRVNKLGYGIWIDPRNNQKILVGDEDMYGLIWSQDGGATWSAPGTGFTGRGSRGVAFDPTDSQRVYAGALSGIGFFKSTDGGLTWSPRRFGSSAVYVIAVAVEPSSPNVVYVGTQNEGFFKSTDYGDTWASIVTGLSGAITYLTVDPTEGGRLFASTATAFYLSEDGGVTWTNVLNSPAWTVTIDPGDPSRVYATARTQGVFRSSDGGHTWQSVNSGLTSLTMGRTAPVIVDPTNRQTLYVGSEVGGVFKSLDGGDHWFGVNSGLSDLSVLGLAMDPAKPSVLYACGPSGVFKTLTGAEVQTNSIAISAILNGASNLQAPVSPGEIVVITGSGLGPAELIAATAAANELYSAQLSGTTIRFNAIPAPLIYTSATQVAVQVPNMFLVSQAQVAVTFEGRTSAPLPIQVAGVSPGVFTLDGSGKGPAVALNQDGSLNTASNPAKVGDVISLFVTGLRQGDGPLTVMIGGAAIVPSTKNLSSGVLQIDANIPVGIQTGGAVPVAVAVGSTSSQAGVTIAVR